MTCGKNINQRRISTKVHYEEDVKKFLDNAMMCDREYSKRKYQQQH